MIADVTLEARLRDRLLMHKIDTILFELEEVNLRQAGRPSEELRRRCQALLVEAGAHTDAAEVSGDDGPSLLDRLFAAQHLVMRRLRSPEFAHLPNDFD
jgi:hypothetical protein